MRLLAALVVALVGCTNHSAVVPYTGEPPRAPRIIEGAAVGPPVTVELRVAARSASGVKLVAVVRRNSAVSIPVRVWLSVPSGVHISGATTWELSPNVEADVVETSFDASFSSVPSEDLELVAEAQSASFGVRAKAAYRFGRPEPVQVRPEREGGSVRVGDTEVGPAIPVK